MIVIGGITHDIGETGCSLGTTIQVEDLFFNTPARKKFLKTNHTEGGRISDFITKLALSRPDIAFRLISNNKATMMTPGNGALFDTIRSVYGSQVANALLALAFEDEDVKITGYITKPSMLKSSRAWQTFIVNGRIISNKAIAKAIDNAYHSLLPKAGFPMVVLNIAVPQCSIDVNVHPQKSEMKFEDEGRIFKAVYKAVIDAIRPVGQTLENVAASVQNVERRYTMEPMQFIASSQSPRDGHCAGNDSVQMPFGITEMENRSSTVSAPPTMSFIEAQNVLKGESAAYHDAFAAKDTFVREAQASAYAEQGAATARPLPELSETVFLRKTSHRSDRSIFAISLPKARMRSTSSINMRHMNASSTTNFPPWRNASHHSSFSFIRFCRSMREKRRLFRKIKTCFGIWVLIWKHAEKEISD